MDIENLNSCLQIDSEGDAIYKICQMLVDVANVFI